MRKGNTARLPGNLFRSVKTLSCLGPPRGGGGKMGVNHCASTLVCRTVTASQCFTVLISQNQNSPAGGCKLPLPLHILIVRDDPEVRKPHASSRAFSPGICKYSGSWPALTSRQRREFVRYINPIFATQPLPVMILSPTKQNRE